MWVRNFPQQLHDCMRNKPASKYPMAKISRSNPPPPHRTHESLFSQGDQAVIQSHKLHHPSRIKCIPGAEKTPESPSKTSRKDYFAIRWLAYHTYLYIVQYLCIIFLFLFSQVLASIYCLDKCPKARKDQQVVKPRRWLGDMLFRARISRWCP